ncbi:MULTISPECIES: hypothetical protein [unclassified Pseudoalteromonas]|uniref:hypothetical protein n=1 Tax=Pseudoalteromonas sp. '520P1 No. 412' TaxID=304208 RepID=UPI000A8B023C|nr:hypothetical protein [Pseudoalteromonas sp. '520P1 No. 412']
MPKMSLVQVKLTITLSLSFSTASNIQVGSVANTNQKPPQEVAQKADIIITMVSDTPQVEDVLFG